MAWSEAGYRECILAMCTLELFANEQVLVRTFGSKNIVKFT